MSQRTWVCIPCGKSFRRGQENDSVHCPAYKELCEYVHWKIHVPSPSRRKAWDQFWDKYRAEKKLLDSFNRGELHESVTFELLNMVLKVG